MKTRTLILAGILIIAFALMAAPVMADQPDTIGLTGTKGSDLSFSVANDTLVFDSFSTGTHHISPTVPGGANDPFANIVLSTNDATWHIYVYEAGGDGKMARDGPVALTNALGILIPGSAPAGATKNTIAALSGVTTQSLIDGTQTVPTSTSIPVDLSQVVDAADGAGAYTITVTFNYSTT